MGHFDEIIGYPAVKKELERVADILRGNEIYKELGVKEPRGLLLHGDPGLGKTLMATCLVNACSRPMFLCRKDKPDGDFVDAIKDIFDKAKASAPSIVFLDDLDKFANTDEERRNAEEFITVQSCIDDTKDCGVFVLATANSLQCLPDSLLRAGRFDRAIEIKPPRGRDTVAIMGHYLKDKKVACDLDMDLIARLMDGNSCASLEAVINEAGIYAGFDGSREICKEHFLKACLEMEFDVPAEAFDRDEIPDPAMWKQVACHEAGHAIVQEMLEPGSVTLMTIYNADDHYGGFVSAQKARERTGIRQEQLKMLVSLGGRAAVEQMLGICDSGSVRDVKRAFGAAEGLVKYHCTSGFHLRTLRYESENLQHKQEQAMAEEVERSYREAKAMIAANMPLLYRLTAEVMEKGILDLHDVARIHAECRDETVRSA